MALILSADDACLTWAGAISVEVTEEGVRPWRIPCDQRDLFPFEDFHEGARMPAGVRIAFTTDSDVVAGACQVQDGAKPIDLVSDGELAGSQALDGTSGFRFEGLGREEKLIELWLPQYGWFRLKSLELSDGATVKPFRNGRPRWITYGSSITQCGEADSPTGTWPAIVARRCGLNLTCLGFGGHCHLDVMIARMIRDLPADFITACLGINVYGSGSLNSRTFRPAVIGFVSIVREKHPDVPLVLMSPIYVTDIEVEHGNSHLTIEQIREEIEAAVAALGSHGDKHLHYVNGLEILGPEQRDLLIDGLHPGPQGYALMARNFKDKVVDRVLA